MASGHVNRTNRPNTWLHRPSLRREESPCQSGAVHTWHVADLTNTSGKSLLCIPKRTRDIALLQGRDLPTSQQLVCEQASPTP